MTIKRHQTHQETRQGSARTFVASVRRSKPGRGVHLLPEPFASCAALTTGSPLTTYDSGTRKNCLYVGLGFKTVCGIVVIFVYLFGLRKLLIHSCTFFRIVISINFQVVITALCKTR